MEGVLAADFLAPPTRPRIGGPAFGVLKPRAEARGDLEPPPAEAPPESGEIRGEVPSIPLPVPVAASGRLRVLWGVAEPLAPFLPATDGGGDDAPLPGGAAKKHAAIIRFFGIVTVTVPAPA